MESFELTIYRPYWQAHNENLFMLFNVYSLTSRAGLADTWSSVISRSRI